MDPRYTGEILKHLDKQSELLMDAYNSMSNQLHKLQVEEEMLMRKCFEIMSAQGVVKKNGDNGNVRIGDQVGNSTPSLTNNSNSPNGGHGRSAELVPPLTSKREPEI